MECGAVGSALDWGSRGRGFKSRHSDQIKAQTLIQKQPSILEGCFCVYARKVLVSLVFRAFSVSKSVWVDE